MGGALSRSGTCRTACKMHSIQAARRLLRRCSSSDCCTPCVGSKACMVHPNTIVNVTRCTAANTTLHTPTLIAAPGAQCSACLDQTIHRDPIGPLSDYDSHSDRRPSWQSLHRLMSGAGAEFYTPGFRATRMPCTWQSSLQCEHGAPRPVSFTFLRTFPLPPPPHLWMQTSCNHPRRGTGLPRCQS